MCWEIHFPVFLRSVSSSLRRFVEWISIFSLGKQRMGEAVPCFAFPDAKVSKYSNQPTPFCLITKGSCGDPFVLHFNSRTRRDEGERYTWETLPLHSLPTHFTPFTTNNNREAEERRRERINSVSISYGKYYTRLEIRRFGRRPCSCRPASEPLAPGTRSVGLPPHKIDPGDDSSRDKHALPWRCLRGGSSSQSGRSHGSPRRRSLLMPGLEKEKSWVKNRGVWEWNLEIPCSRTANVKGGLELENNVVVARVPLDCVVTFLDSVSILPAHVAPWPKWAFIDMGWMIVPVIMGRSNHSRLFRKNPTANRVPIELKSRKNHKLTKKKATDQWTYVESIPIDGCVRPKKNLNRGAGSVYGWRDLSSAIPSKETPSWSFLFWNLHKSKEIRH